MADIDRALAQLSSRLGEVPPELSGQIWSRLSGEPVAIPTRRPPRRTLRVVLVAAALVAGLAAAVAIVAVRNPPSEPAAGTTASVQPPPATSAEIPSVVLQSPLIDADLPRGWTPITWLLDRADSNEVAIAAASFPIVVGEPGENCTPTSARAQMGPSDVIVRVYARRVKHRVPERPARIVIPPAVSLECVGNGSVVSFRIGDIEINAQILVNGSPSPAALRQAEDLIASIRPAAALLPITTASRIYVGVACSEPNSIRCGRVGVAVWPTGDVGDVKAQIGPYTTELHRTGDFLSGFITVPDLIAPPFGIRASAAGQWFGTPPAEVDVRITATTGGAPFGVTIHTSIAAGWG